MIRMERVKDRSRLKAENDDDDDDTINNSSYTHAVSYESAVAATGVARA